MFPAESAWVLFVMLVLVILVLFVDALRVEAMALHHAKLQLTDKWLAHLWVSETFPIYVLTAITVVPTTTVVRASAIASVWSALSRIHSATILSRQSATSTVIAVLAGATRNMRSV